jgi:uncharacterized membrane protein (DUF4010 family)
MLVVLVLGTSFVGYVLSRRLGEQRGLMATAAVGALVSSTAVTASYARQLKADGAPERALAAGILLAGAVMHARVLALAGVMLPAALPSLALVLAPALLLQAGLAVLFLRRAGADGGPGPLALGNPLAFGPALLLVGLVMLLAVVARALLERFGDLSLGWLLALTGLLDVDAALVTAAGLPQGLLPARTIGLMLALPVMGNSLWKAALCLVLSGGRAGWPAAGGLAAAVALAAALWSALF